MPDLRFEKINFRNAENNYIDLDEFLSLKKKGVNIPEEVIVVPVSLSENPSVFHKAVQIKQAMPRMDITNIVMMVKAKLNPNAVTVDTKKLMRLFPGASGEKIISDIQNNKSLSNETATTLIRNRVIASSQDSFEINEVWDYIYNMFGLTDEQGAVTQEVIETEPEIIAETSLPVAEASMPDEIVMKTSAKASTAKNKKAPKTILGKLFRPVAAAKARKAAGKKAPKTMLGKLLRPVAAIKAAKGKKPKTVLGKLLRPVAAVKAAKSQNKVAEKLRAESVTQSTSKASNDFKEAVKAEVRDQQATAVEAAIAARPEIANNPAAIAEIKMEVIKEAIANTPQSAPQLFTVVKEVIAERQEVAVAAAIAAQPEIANAPAVIAEIKADVARETIMSVPTTVKPEVLRAVKEADALAQAELIRTDPVRAEVEAVAKAAARGIQTMSIE